MKKQELLDEEKRQRVQEMESTGLSHKRVIDIPFGVRAIQGGVEVDGIWISRPTTPNTRKSMAPPGMASTTTIAVTANPLLAKAQAQGGKLPSPTDTPTKVAHSTPYMPTGYNAGQPTSPGHHDPMSSLGGPPNLNRNPSGHNRSSRQRTNEDALSRLEGGPRQPPQTYVPKATPSTAAQLQQRLGVLKPQQRLPLQQQARQAPPPPPPPKNKQKQPQRSPLRDSASSDDSYTSGGPTNEHYYDGAQRARVVSLSHYPSQSSSRVATGSSSGPGSPVREWGASSSRTGPYGQSTPNLPQIAFLPSSQSESQLPLLSQDYVQMLEPTFGPGDLRHNSGRPHRANQDSEAGNLDRSGEGDSSGQRGPPQRRQKNPYGQQ